MFLELKTADGCKLVHKIVCINCGTKKYAVPIAKTIIKMCMWEYIENNAHCCDDPDYFWVLGDK